MDKVRLGVLSHAHGHVGAYCGVLRDFPDAEVVASWDDNPERSRAAAANHGSGIVRPPWSRIPMSMR